MATETWSGMRDWLPNSFVMQVVPNERSFSGYYSGQDQVIDLLGERWMCRFTLPARNSESLGAQREALIDRLRRSNTVSIWHLQRPQPRGTMRGSPTLSASVSQLASTISIQATAGETLLPGDMIGFGGQVSRVQSTYTANGSGVFSNVSIWPRARTAVASGQPVTWDKPTVLFRSADREPAQVVWLPGRICDELTLNLIEA